MLRIVKQKPGEKMIDKNKKTDNIKLYTPFENQFTKNERGNACIHNIDLFLKSIYHTQANSLTYVHNDTSLYIRHGWSNSRF